MSRTLLIARREFLAYAKTVGFWLSLLAFPFFAIVGGAVPVLMRTSEPVRQVALVEEGPSAQGLAAAVREALRLDQERRQAAQAQAEEAAARTTGMPKEAIQAAQKQGGAGGLSALRRQRVAIVDTPAALAAAQPGADQERVVRQLLDQDAPKAGRLDAVVFLNRAGAQPTARVWTRRATDDRVEDFIRDALRTAYRGQVFQAAGIDPQVVQATERFRPDVKAFSPKSASGGQVGFRDRLPAIIGLASGFLLWSLIITGASILLNSVMEEKSNKILEVLLSSASPTEILTGKVLGVAMLTLTVLCAWGGLGALALIQFLPQYAPMVGDVLLDSGMIFYFLAYAAGGYLMYAVLFAAIGAFCETPRDAQTLMGPIMMVLIIPIMVMQMALTSPDAPVVRILSWVPFFTPFLMSARAPSEPPMIEIVGTMAGMFAMALLMVWIAGRAFRAGALSDVKLSWKSFAGAVRGGGN